ncbi:MAG: hypothetical protein IPJ86_05445 [Bacteroidetes bacterium]|nr:hypothetical protein [Bacteroidota bacterium]
MSATILKLTFTGPNATVTIGPAAPMACPLNGSRRSVYERSHSVEK